MATFGNRGYGAAATLRSVAASATGTKLFTTNSSGRLGWIASIGTFASGIIYFVIVPAGATAPTLTDVTTGAALEIDRIDPSSAKYTAEGGVGADYDVYAVTSTGAACAIPVLEVF